MKRVVRIERQGKRSDGRASTQGIVVTPEEIDRTVALIQALIPLGMFPNSSRTLLHKGSRAPVPTLSI